MRVRIWKRLSKDYVFRNWVLNFDVLAGAAHRTAPVVVTLGSNSSIGYHHLYVCVVVHDATVATPSYLNNIQSHMYSTFLAAVFISLLYKLIDFNLTKA